MKRSNLTATLWLVLVFVSGLLVGVFGQRLYSAKTVRAEQSRIRPSPEEFRRRYVADMKGRLKLEAQQVQQVETILDETKLKFDAVRERTRPEMKAIQEDQQARIRALLNDTQKVEYAKMLEERERRMKQGGSGNRH